MTIPLTEFIVLTLKNHGNGGDPSQPPPAAWSNVTGTLKATQGVNAVYTGSQLEDPSKTVLVVEWASPAAFSDFAASESYTPWFASLKAVTAHSSTGGVLPPLFYKVPFAPDSDPSAVLGAPCTEVFVAYGVDPSFSSHVSEFAKNLQAAGPELGGFHGQAYGDISTPLAVDGSGDDEKGPAVTLCLGWDSKEAHLEAKAKAGALSDNIHLLRSGRKAISMYHVNLRRV